MTFVSHGVGRYRRSLTVVVLIVGLCVPMPLLAHTHLVKSLPAAGARLADSPKLLRLWFSEAPELALTRITLVTERGDTIPLGVVSRDPAGARTVAAAIPGILSPGIYRVRWRTAAADGHSTHGEFTFTVIPARAGGTAGVPSSGRWPASHASLTPAPTRPIDTVSKTGAASFDVLSPLYVAIRSLWLTALVIVIGTVAFRLFVVSALDDVSTAASLSMIVRTRTTQLGFWGAAVLGATALARLAAQSAVFDGTAVTSLLGHTTWGVGWLVHIGALTLTALGFAVARQPARGQRPGWTLATLGALVLAVTPALSGHAIATPRFTVLAVLNDAGHVLGAGGWLGSLFVLVSIGLPALRHLDPAARGQTAATLVNRFSDTALVCAALTLVTGTVSAWIHLGSVPALWQTGYGRTLLVKLGVLALVVALGAYHWRVAQPALGRGGGDGARRLQKSASLELFLGACIIALTAILVATPAPTE